MQLKLATFDKVNCSVSTQFIELCPKTTVEYRSPITNEFSPTHDKIPSMVPSDIVALVIQNNVDNSVPIIKIDKHQGAYILDDSKTIEVINTPCDFDDLQIWVSYENKPWEKESVHSFIDEMRYRRTDFKYCVTRDGSDPNNAKRVETENKNSIIWMINSKGTSATWRPCSQFEYDTNRNNPDFGFKHCEPGEDPNQTKQEWLK